MTKRTLVMDDALLAEILRAAAEAYPDESCGLIEGADEDGGWRAVAVHRAKNVAPKPSSRFLIDPQIQFDLMRALRGGETRILGCFHSHPNGEAEPSATDEREASERGFLYLIAGGGPDTFTLKAFVFEGGGFAEIALE